MKVEFRDIKAGSGVDIFIKSLSDGIKALGMSCSITLYPSYYQYIPSLLKFKRDGAGDPRVVHSNINYGYVFKDRDPLVVTEHLVVHDPSMERYASYIQKIYYRGLYRRERKSLKVADAVTCVSEYAKRMLEKAFEYSDSRVIYNGVNADVFKPLPHREDVFSDKKILLLFVGNLSRRKGADLLPRIMKKLGDDFQLLTTSGLRKDVKTNINNIATLGRLSEKQLVDLYNSCDIYLFPSRLEGFGLTIAEAMACGKPVVATDYSSIPELVVEGKGGLLCKMDDVDDFADKVRLLAQDESTRRSMGEYNRKRILNNFTLKEMAFNYLKLYKSLL
jgi:glycosyltransferase involved in cell wall biosynthesis